MEGRPETGDEGKGRDFRIGHGLTMPLAEPVCSALVALDLGVYGECTFGGVGRSVFAQSSFFIPNTAQRVKDMRVEPRFTAKGEFSPQLHRSSAIHGYSPILETSLLSSSSSDDRPSCLAQRPSEARGTESTFIGRSPGTFPSLQVCTSNFSQLKRGKGTESCLSRNPYASDVGTGLAQMIGRNLLPLAGLRRSPRTRHHPCPDDVVSP